MPRRLAALSFFACILTNGAAYAVVVTTARDSVAMITFGDSAFRDARLQIDATQTIGAGSTGAKNVVFDAAPSLESYALSSTGAVGVTLNAFTPPSTFDLTVNASGAGSWRVTEGFGVSEDLFGPGPLYRYGDGNDAFVPFVNNRLPALELILAIGGLVDDGGRFGVGFVIPGDWSTTGGLASTSHQYFLANLDDEWVIDTAFVYDRSANVTRFHATNNAYEGLASDHPSPFLDVYFFGSVPEPEPWILLMSAGAAGFALRRRRAPIEPSSKKSTSQPTKATLASMSSSIRDARPSPGRCTVRTTTRASERDLLQQPDPRRLAFQLIGMSKRFSEAAIAGRRLPSRLA